MMRRFIHLSDWERSRIMVLVASGHSVREISRTLCRAPSTISRELRRNGHEGGYSALLAVKQAKKRRVYTNKQRKLWLCPRLKSYVIGCIKRGWSPEMISGRIACMIGKSSDYYISHETIYASIYALPRGELRKEIIAALRQSRKKRGPRKHRTGSQIPDLRPISQRPQEVQDRQMPGHWEGDLIKGPGNKSSIGTLVERTSRYLIMVQLDDASSEEVTSGFVRQLKSVPGHLLKTLTYDRGSEMTQHKRITQALRLSMSQLELLFIEVLSIPPVLILSLSLYNGILISNTYCH